MADMLKDVLDTIEHLDLRFNEIIDMERDFVFTSGSRFTGFANHMSDVDFFVISDKAKGPYANMVIPLDHGSYVDIEFHKHEYMNHLIAEINKAAADNYDEVRSINLRNFDTYYRILIGEPVVNNQLFHSMQAELHKEHFTEILKIRYGLECQNNLQMAELSRKEEDMEAACHFMENAIGVAVDSVLVTHGECYPHPKWRFEKITRALGTSSDLYRKAWQLKALGKRDITNYIQEGTKFCQELGMDSYPKPSITIKYEKARNVHLVESYKRSFLVKDKLYICSVTPEACYLWTLIDGKSTRDNLSSLVRSKFNYDARKSNSITAESLKLLQLHGFIEKIYTS